MTSPIKALRTVGVYVEDQERAEKWYRDALGFEVRARVPMGPTMAWLEMSPPGAETRLVIYPKAMMENWRELKPSIVYSVPDVRKAHDELAKRGVEFPMPPQKMPWGFFFAQFVDPDGNIFGLSEQPL